MKKDVRIGRYLRMPLDIAWIHNIPDANPASFIWGVVDVQDSIDSIDRKIEALKAARVSLLQERKQAVKRDGTTPTEAHVERGTSQRKDNTRGPVLAGAGF